MTKEQLEDKITSIISLMEELVRDINNLKDNAKELLTELEMLPEAEDIEDDKKSD